MEPVASPLVASERARLAAATRQELERAARLLRPQVGEIQTLMVDGTPSEQIEAAVEAIAADLIVMGTHGRRGIARALLGSVAARVLRASTVPVLTVPEYVAVSRNDAGRQLGSLIDELHLERPRVLALSRGALTVATTLAEKTNGAVDLCDVELVVTTDGTSIGALGEDNVLLLDGAAEVDGARRDEAVTAARERLRAELLARADAR